jgi:DNA-directed RNA polymerase specialized sigma24 family protein
MLTEIQKITLRDILITTGLTERQVEDIFLLLRFKPERVQLAFYYRACGNTYEEIGGFMDEPLKTVHDLVTIGCKDIFKYLAE